MDIFFDIELLVDQEMWGSIFFSDDRDAMDFEPVQETPQHEFNLGTPGIAPPFNMSMATLYDFETTANTPTVLAIPDLSPSYLKAPTLAISEVTAVETKPSTPKAPMLAISQVQVLFCCEAIQLGRLEADMTDTVAPEQSFEHAEYCRGSQSEDPSCDGVLPDLYVPTTPILKETGVREAPGSDVSDPIVIDDETDDKRPKIKAKAGTNGMSSAATRCTEAQYNEKTALGTLGSRKRSKMENYDTNDVNYRPFKRRSWR